MRLLCASTPRAGGGRLDAESETLIPTNGGVFDVAHVLPETVGALVTGHTPNGHGHAGTNSQAVAAGHVIPVAFGWQNAAAQGMSVDTIAPTLDKSKHPATATATAVRRLLPVECERLQGFPDNYTLVPYRGKLAKDGPRYKALGNSWAVNCARWIGRRIAMVDAIKKQHREAA